MSSKSKTYDEYDEDFNDFEDDYSTTKQATSNRSVKHQTEQSSFRTNENTNVNNSYENEASFNRKGGLSSSELKTKLIETFKNKGIFDSLKVFEFVFSIQIRFFFSLSKIK
jgi:hypothetical protein